MLALKTFRDKALGVADLLNHAALIDDGKVQGKDGSVLAGYYFRGPDLQSSLDSERDALTERVNAALARLGGGWVSWTDTVRVPAEDYPPPELSHFPDPISRLVDEERRRQFEREGAHYETRHVLILQYTPPLRRQTRVLDMIYDDDTGADSDKGYADRVLAKFEKDLQDIEDAIAGAVRLERMRTYVAADNQGVEHLRDELVNYLHFCLTGQAVELNLPPGGAYLDAVLGGWELWPGDTPRYGEYFLCCVGIEGFAQESWAQILDELDHQPFRYRWSSRMIYLDTHEALHELRKYRRKWKQKIRGFFAQVFKLQGGVINQDAVLMTAEAEDALARTSSGLVGTGYYTSVVVLMERDRAVLAENARLVVRTLNRLGFAARIETVNTMEAWLGSQPGHPVPNVRRPLLHTDNLADVLPLASVWTGLPSNPCPFYPPNSPPLLYAATLGATPFKLNLHVGDVGHTLVFGPIGSGKTTLLCTVAMQALRYPGVRLWWFDYKLGGYAVTKACGGRHYNIAGEGAAPAFCPLAVLETDADLEWAEDWIGLLFELQMGRPPDPGHRDAIHRAMLLLQADAAPGARTLTNFWSQVQDNQVRDAIQYYTLKGSLGRMLDAEEDNIAYGRFVTFEMEELLALKEQAVIPVLSYLFRRFERSLDGRPTYLLLDEAWVPLGNPVFRERLEKWLRITRSKNCAVILATQVLSDAVRSGLLDLLVDACPTKIFLPNEEAATPGTPEHPGPLGFYQAMGLNEAQVQVIRGATKKRHYYLVSPEGRRLFDLGLGPVALAFAGASGKEDVNRIARLEAIHGDQWPWAWLDEKGVDHAALRGKPQEASHEKSHEEKEVPDEALQ